MSGLNYFSDKHSTKTKPYLSCQIAITNPKIKSTSKQT